MVRAGGAGARLTPPRLAAARRFAAGAAVVAVALIVIVVGFLLATGPDYLNYSDNALMQLRTVDVGRHLLLVGAYSRFTWAHPGPLLFWLFAGPFTLFGGDAKALGIASVMIGAGACALTLHAARRGGPELMTTCALVTVLFVRSLGVSLLVDPWNPSVSLLPCLAFIVVVWATRESSPWTVPLVAGLGSLLVQSHLGYAPIVLVGFIATAVAVVPRARAGTERWQGPLIVTGVVGLLAWLPPVVDQIAGSGNLGAILRYFGGGGGPAVGWHAGLYVVFEQLGARPGFARGLDPGSALLYSDRVRGSLPFPLALIPFALAVALAARRGWRDILRFAAVIGGSLVVAVIAVAQIRGVVAPYLVRWTWILGGAVWILVLWTALRALRDPWRTGGVIVVAGASVLFAVNVATVAHYDLPPPRLATQPSPATVRRLVDAVEHAIPAGSTIWMRPEPRKTWIFVMPTLVTELEDQGYRIVVDDSLRAPFGRSRVRDRRPRVPRVVVSVDWAIGRQATRPGNELLTIARQPGLRVALFLRAPPGGR